MIILKAGGSIMTTKTVVYMVTYKDDSHRTHITFVKGFSAVKFLEERFSEVYFETTETYPHIKEEDYTDLLPLLI